MSALGGSAFGKPLHELAQGWNVELAMLHFVNDEIIVGRGKFQADVIAIAPFCVGVIDGLPIRQKLNRFVEAFRLVVRVTALRPHS